MKLINLTYVKPFIVAIVLLAPSCHSSENQGNNSSANVVKSDSVAANPIKTKDSAAAIRNVNSANSPNSGTSHSWSLIITPNTTKSHLDSIAAKWKNENVDLTISKFKCDGNGRLVKIKGAVTINTKNGNASAEFKSENLASIHIKVDDSPNVTIKGD